jgi:hypothetical protein
VAEPSWLAIASNAFAKYSSAVMAEFPCTLPRPALAQLYTTNVGGHGGGELGGLEMHRRRKKNFRLSPSAHLGMDDLDAHGI